MSYDYFALNEGQEGGSPINVAVGTIDLATAIAQAASAAAEIAAMQTLIASGTIINSGGTTITTTFNTDMTTIANETGSVVTALGTLNQDMIYLYNAGLTTPPTRMQNMLAMKVIEEYLQTGYIPYGQTLDTRL